MMCGSTEGGQCSEVIELEGQGAELTSQTSELHRGSRQRKVWHKSSRLVFFPPLTITVPLSAGNLCMFSADSVLFVHKPSNKLQVEAIFTKMQGNGTITEVTSEIIL